VGVGLRVWKVNKYILALSNQQPPSHASPVTMVTPSPLKPPNLCLFIGFKNYDSKSQLFFRVVSSKFPWQSMRIASTRFPFLTQLSFFNFGLRTTVPIKHIPLNPRFSRGAKMSDTAKAPILDPYLLSSTKEFANLKCHGRNGLQNVKFDY